MSMPARALVDAPYFVARPGIVRVDGPGSALLRSASGSVHPTIAARGANYARTGQVLQLHVEGSELRAIVKGSRDALYHVELTLGARTSAFCDCPFTETSTLWCKHVIATLYVAADVLDNSDELPAHWDPAAGSGLVASCVDAEEIPTDELVEMRAALRSPRRRYRSSALLADAVRALAPPPELEALGL